MMEIDMTKRSVFDRLGRSTQPPHHKNRAVVCSFWLQGRCNRNPCRFLHSDLSTSQQENEGSSAFDRHHHHHSGNKFQHNSWRNPNKLHTSKNVQVSSSSSSTVESLSNDVNNADDDHVGQEKVLTTADQKLCKYWVTGNCVKGDECKDLHSWFSGSGFSPLTKLERHNKAVTGIALPSGSDKLFSGSKDKSVCVWDCNTGQCVGTIKLEGEIGCLISEEGQWVFVGLQNAVKAWNISTNTELVLTGPSGLVNALVVGDDMLFAGVQDGSILAWKSNISESSTSTSPMATLNGHRLAVLSLIVGANMLYSGSKDGTIRVWELKTLECVQILEGHTNSVTSLLCWDAYLFSGSLDGTLKVWGATESGSLKVMHEIKGESGITALCGVHDAKAKPVLICSRRDNTVRLYDLPIFAERGRIYSKTEVQSLQAVEMSGGGLFFIGNAAGELSVWKLLGEAS